MLLCAYCFKPLLHIRLTEDAPENTDYMIMHGKCWEERARIINLRAEGVNGYTGYAIRKGADVR